MFCNLDVENEARDRLIQINNTCEEMWLIYRKLGVLFVISMTILPLFSVLSNWFIDGDLIVDHFYRPIRTMYVSIRKIRFKSNFREISSDTISFNSSTCSLPWSQSTIVGYFGEQLLINVMCFIYSVINGVLLLLFISICLHYRTFYEIIKHWIDEWNNENANGNTNRCDEKFLCELIRFHVSAKK